MALQRTSGHLIPVTINPSLEKANYIAKFRDQDTATLVKSLISETSTVVTIEGHVTATSLDVNYIDLNPQDDAPSFREGRQWYDNHKKSIAAFVDTGDVQVNYGREILIRIKNGTDQPILNGMVVTPYSKDGFIYPGEDDAVLVAPADCTIREACALVAVATHDILPGNIGYATRIGEVGGLNNTGFVKGDLLYIDPENPGYLTKIKPLEGAFPIAIGSVQKVDDSEGVLVVDILNTGHTTEEVNTRGFPFSQRANTILNLNYTTRVFSITPTNGKFHYYVNGEKFLRYGSASVTIADVTGQHFIYFDKGVLIDTTDTSEDKLFEILTKHCMVAQVYWDSLTQQAFHRGDKRYGINMGTETRYFLYREFGLQFISGCALNNFTIGDGSLDSHAQYTIDAGITQEADLRHTMASTTGMAVFYRGPDGWARQYNDSFSILSAPAGRMYYNPITGSTGSLVQATSGNYVYYHVFVSNNITGAPFVIMGNYQYANENEALQAKYLDAHDLLIDDHPVKDKILIASILFRTRDTYTNSVKSIIIPVEGYNYLDWRYEALPSSTGQDGYNACTVFIYQRGESAPSLPSATVTYTFEGGMISGLSNGWTKNIPDGETTIWISSATAFSRTSSDTILASEWSEARIFAKKGDQGIQGVQGEKGDQGIQGNTGANGASAFFHIKYSNSMNPSSSADMNDTGGAYIGTYVDSIQVDSSNPADYTWVLVKGAQGVKGDQGIAGTNGENGVTSYLHIKYADVASPTDAQINDVSGEYIGTYVGTEIDDPPYASWYKWVKIKGNKGDQGADAVQVNVISTTGSAFRETDANLSGVITAQVMQGMSDITSTIEDFRFNWKRISASENPADDESWNTSSKAIGHKSISITNNDCIGRTVFICEVDIQGE